MKPSDFCTLSMLFLAIKCGAGSMSRAGWFWPHTDVWECQTCSNTCW